MVPCVKSSGDWPIRAVLLKVTVRPWRDYRCETPCWPYLLKNVYYTVLALVGCGTGTCSTRTEDHNCRH